MRILFLGTPEIAKTCLEAIVKSGKHEIVGVVTKVDKPAGRGKKLVETPVKTYAKSIGLEVFQFENFKVDGEALIRKLKPDVLVLVAFGVILSPEILSLALPINLHGSMLPLYRGPSPIQTAILRGEAMTGVTVMKMASEVDAGDILLQKVVQIAQNDTSKTLFEKMAITGGEALVEALDLIESGKAKFVPQDHSKATFTSVLTKDNARLDFSDTALNVVNKIRAYNPNPVAFMTIDEMRLKVYAAKVVELDLNLDDFKNGEIVMASGKTGLVVKAADGFVEILELQAPNGKVMSAKNLLNGLKIPIGKVCGV